MTRIIKNCAITFVLALTITSHVSAKTPEHIFEEVSASIVIVDILDAKGEKTGHGSGVVVATGAVVTNCHVTDKATFLQVRWKGTVYSATLEYHHPYQDLCIVSAPDLDAPNVSLSATQNLKIGSKVFAIGAPRGLELTMSDGIVSGLRNVDASVVIQTNAAMSPGSSGGGLFNEDGRLVGITTRGFTESQNLNFALSADLIPGLQAEMEIARSRRAAEERLKSERRQAENRKLAETRKALDVARQRLESEKRKQDEATRIVEEEQRLEGERRQVEAETLKIQEERRMAEDQLIREEEETTPEGLQRLALSAEVKRKRATQGAAEATRQQSEAAKRLKEEFIAKIKSKIEQNTSAPEGMSGNPRAEFTIVLLPTGEVLSVKLVNSSGNTAYDDAVERGIFKSAPLPVPPNNPELFREFRELRLPFTYVRR